MITSARLFTTRTLTPTPPFIISPHIPAIAKKVSLAVNSRDFAVFVLKTQDFLEKGAEMVSFFEQRGYSPALLQNDLQAIRRFDRTDMLKNHNPSNQRSERIPLVRTYHPLNERVKRILYFPETRAVFPQPPLVAFAVAATSVISSCIPRTAANPVLRRVHLRAYTLAVALAITFLATPTSVALNTLLSSRTRFLVKRLALCTASPVAIALPSISVKQGVH